MTAWQNELHLAQSPYLQQHKNNPVGWKMWSPDAFEEARRRNVPVLVSIGYATCHWCHVMAHEVFEDEHAAGLMNETLVCIKVDREENPEVDEIYMEACQAMNGSGGWPLNIFVDHEGKPFFAATYVPLPNWNDLLEKISNAWKHNASEIEAFTNDLANALQQDQLTDKAYESVDINSLLFEYLEKSFDPENPDFSGQGRSPRFPSHTLYFYLLSRRKIPANIGGMLIEALTTLQDSGLYDRVGGGFHRYSTDATWRVPHFEKMLYDNAQLIGAFALAGNRFNRPDLTHTAARTADYLMRDLSVFADGVFTGYACAEDADDPGGEGSFYAWTDIELRTALGHREGTLLSEAWNITSNPENIHGVYPHRIPHPRGSEIFRHEHPDAQIHLRIAWEAAYEKLLSIRNERQRPFRDTKVLTDWNALALSGMSILYANTLEAKYREEVVKLASVLLGRITDGTIVRLPGKPGHLTDYGHTALALFTTWEAIGDERYMDAAVELVKNAFTLFSSPDGVLYSSMVNSGIFMRYEEKYDHTQPAGAHSLILAWVRLSAHQRLLEFAPLAHKIISRQKRLAETAHIMMPAFLCALDEYENGPVTLTSPPLYRKQHPGILRWVGSQVRLLTDADQQTFQLCEKDRCLKPATSEAALEDILQFELS